MYARTEVDVPGGLGPIYLAASGEGPGLTPASHLALEAIGRFQRLLRGVGIDWGSGSGCLAIAAAKIPSVDLMVGLELDADAVAISRQNVRLNDVENSVTILRSDAFSPLPDEDGAVLEGLVNRADFVVANPPASQGDDGLGWRRRLLDGARRFLVPAAPLLVQIASVYGLPRIEGLANDAAGFRYHGLLASSELLPFDQQRSDLSRQLIEYVAEEGRGGLPYTFFLPDSEGEQVDAREALHHHRRTGESPLARWQVHLFRRLG